MVTRIAKDKYFTNPQITKALLNIAPIKGWVYEPCVGKGHILKVLKERVDVNCFGGDIDPVGDNFLRMDATCSHEWQNIQKRYSRFNWVVSNPPYSQPDCQEIINNAWEYASDGVAMLLRLSYLEPCLNKAGGYRGEFLKEAPLSHLIVFNPRPKFRTDTKGTDSSTVAWFVWQKEWMDGTQIHFINDWDKLNR